MRDPARFVCFSAASSRFTSRWNAAFGRALLRFGALALVACSGGGHERFEVQDDAPATFESQESSIGQAPAQQFSTLAKGRCEAGSVIECKVLLGTHGDVANCMVGLQVCGQGQWGECLSESDAEKQLAASD